MSEMYVSPEKFMQVAAQVSPGQLWKDRDNGEVHRINTIAIHAAAADPLIIYQRHGLNRALPSADFLAKFVPSKDLR